MGNKTVIVYDFWKASQGWKKQDIAIFYDDISNVFRYLDLTDLVKNQGVPETLPAWLDFMWYNDVE